MTQTAAALIVGNEILTGKIQDQNTAYLAKELFKLGIALRRVVVCPDEMDAIVQDVNDLRASHDLVFTSGGVGPTHDDITLDAVARAFDRELVRSAEVEAMIRKYHGQRVSEGHLRMANMPEGATLIRNAEVPWPTIQIENVYVLPGVPQIFELKFQVIRRTLEADAPFVSRAVYTLADEGELAELLLGLTKAHPDVTIGSYPRWRDPRYKVKLTFDGKNEAAVIRARDALIASLPAEKIVESD